MLRHVPVSGLERGVHGDPLLEGALVSKRRRPKTSPGGGDAWWHADGPELESLAVCHRTRPPNPLDRGAGVGP